MFYNLGSINIDHVYRVGHFVQPGETLASQNMQTLLGGKGANQSLALARAGEQVRHIGSVSRADNWALELLAESNVDVSAIEKADQASGHAIIQVDDAGENAIVLHGGANQSLTQEYITQSLAPAKAGDWLLMQNETNGIDLAMSIANNKEMLIAFNPAPMSDEVGSLDLNQCAVLILNEIEASQLAGVDDEARATQILLERFPDVQLVLTQGSRGASWYHQSQHEFVAASKVEAVDSTAAGDTFVGYFLAALNQQGNDAALALQTACAAAAIAVTQAGASSSIPDKSRVEQFMQAGA